MQFQMPSGLQDPDSPAVAEPPDDEVEPDELEELEEPEEPDVLEELGGGACVVGAAALDMVAGGALGAGSVG